MRILADIGGTYARFAFESKGQPMGVKKYAASDFESFEDAVEKYKEEARIDHDASLLIATAAHPDENNVWRFVNRNKWEIDVAHLGNVDIILNDFEAATWGLVDLKDQKVLKAGRSNHVAPRVLVGPGTGLGLGYLIPHGREFHVQGTQGGHLATAAITDEQVRVLHAVDKVKDRDCLNVYEDVVSGPGLYNLYAALCFLSDEEQIARNAEELLVHEKSIAVKDAVRLFHEFFALFAATVTVGAGAYGGLYLMGGVLDRLGEKNLFDFAHFEKFFAGNFVPSVKKALANTPIIHVTDPGLALRGLIRAADA
jgi:glucokinase